MEKQDEMFEGSIKRTPRATQTREKAAARKPWAPPSMLDAPVSYTHLTLPTTR